MQFPSRAFVVWATVRIDCQVIYKGALYFAEADYFELITRLDANITQKATVKLYLSKCRPPVGRLQTVADIFTMPCVCRSIMEVV